uniref:Uncharacterized protein n=1 Tax=Poecilia mexicana TaxID=48701 RepID=A0A3B3Z1H2_9TELE
MTTQICLTHSMMDWGVPAMVMARSVELGSISRGTSRMRRVKTNLSDFFDLTATLADERAALAGRHNEAHGDRRFAGGRAVRHGGADVLQEIWRTSDVFHAKNHSITKALSLLFFAQD